MAGRHALSSSAACPLGSRCPCRSLPPRQRQVFHRLLLGDTERQAAAVLDLSPHTVHSHAKRLFERFRVSGRAGLMALALRSALPDAQEKRGSSQRRRHTVCLSDSQREALHNLLAAPESRPGQEILRAQVLLKCANGVIDREVADILSVSTRTIERIRQQFVSSGLEAAISRRPQPLRPEKRKLNDDAKRHLAALFRSRPPRGRDRWTAALLAESLVRRGHVTEVSRDTIRRTWARLEQNSASRALHLSGKVRDADK